MQIHTDRCSGTDQSRAEAHMQPATAADYTVQGTAARQQRIYTLAQHGQHSTASTAQHGSRLHSTWHSCQVGAHLADVKALFLLAALIEGRLRARSNLRSNLRSSERPAAAACSPQPTGAEPPVRGLAGCVHACMHACMNACMLCGWRAWQCCPAPAWAPAGGERVLRCCSAAVLQ